MKIEIRLMPGNKIPDVKTNKGQVIEDALVMVLAAVAITAGKEGFKCLFKVINRNHMYKKKKEWSDYKRDNPIKQLPQAEQEDPESKLKQNDKEVKAYVFDKYGLNLTDNPEGECVRASETEGERCARPLMVGELVSKGDLLLIVSEPGVGKSVLAFQMADDIAEGRESRLFHKPEGHQPPQPVYYWDAEMDSDDMRERYPNGLSSKLVRFAHCNYRDGFYLLKHIYEEVSTLSTDATIVLDNWKALCARIDTYYFTTGLRNLQAQFMEKGNRLTIIIVIHTTKEAIKKSEVDLGDVAGSAQITQAAKNVLFVNPTRIDDCIELHDAKHRTSRKKKGSLVVRKGGVGSDENLHFEAAENDMGEEEIQKLMDELADNAPKKIGRPQSLSNEQVEKVIELLDEGVTPKCLAEKFGVTEGTIRNIKKRK